MQQPKYRTRQELLRELHALQRRTKKKRFGYEDLCYLTMFCVFLVTVGMEFARWLDLHPLFPTVEVEAVFLNPLGPSPTPTPTLLPTPYKDVRVEKLTQVLKDHNSPLTPYASLIVQEADEHDIGWTKIVSISAIESQYGTTCPQISHNAWGIGGSNFRYFTSWEEGIKYTSALLGNNYKENEVRAINAKYCPESDNCNPAWSDVVIAASREILSSN